MSGISNRRHVLVAEDNDEMRKVIAELVASLDLDVTAVSSGSELVRVLTEGPSVDLIVTDVRMPWMTGHQVAQSARNSGIQTPVIVVTAFPDDNLRRSVERLGSAVLLPKPFRPNELLDLVRTQLAL